MTARESALAAPLDETARALRAADTGGLPDLDFPGLTPYDVYVGTEQLHALQRPRTDVPAEMSFLVVTQVMELYFGLLCFEWRQTIEALRSDDVPAAVAALRRGAHHLRALNAAWDSLGWLTPAEFAAFRDQLGEASGFQSAAYREFEFLLGLKSRSMVNPHRANPRAHAALLRALDGPDVYAEAVALLGRRGLLPEEPSAAAAPRDAQESRPAVVDAWARAYTAGDRDLPSLGEAMMDVAELFDDWRHRHLVAVRRTMGGKPGSGGSSGAAWLERAMRRRIFPELWDSRGHC